MSRKLAVLLAAVAVIILAAAAIYLGSRPPKEPAPPPDLTGEWSQNSGGEWYHIATITDDMIEVWWYLPSEDLRELYWQGTFTPPVDGEEPYAWESANNLSMQELSLYKHRRTSREEVKTFTYKDGKLSYVVTAGHLQMVFALERAEE